MAKSNNDEKPQRGGGILLPNFKTQKNQNMYKYRKPTTTTITKNTSYEGETIEHKMDRIKNNKEPITDGAPLIYTERKDGVNPNLDIRTDRWEHAIDAMDALSKSNIARRQARWDALKEAEKPKNNNDGGAEPTQATK